MMSVLSLFPSSSMWGYIFEVLLLSSSLIFIHSIFWSFNSRIIFLGSDLIAGLGERRYIGKDGDSLGYG